MYAFAPVKARCLVYGDGGDAGRLSFCESGIDDVVAERISFYRLFRFSNINNILNSGLRRHDEKQTFPTFCEFILMAPQKNH